MSTEMLHDQGGDWVGLRTESRYVYSKAGRLVGWCLDDQPSLVIDRDGRYLAEIVGNRLFRRTSPPFVPNPGYLPDPGSPSMPSDPGNVGYASVPSGMEDLPRGLLG